MERIRLGMVGGGPGSGIGALHRRAARIAGRFDLVAGAFSSDTGRSAAFARSLGLEHAVADWRALADPGLIDAVVIATPNHLHVPQSEVFLKAGIAVICDKPLGANVAECEALARTVAETGLPFLLTHTYCGHPMVRHARRLVREGALGPVRIVQAHYAQDWAARSRVSGGDRHEGWRFDPARSGIAGTLADVGTHAHHLLRFVTGLEVEALSAMTMALAATAGLEDSAQVSLRLTAGAMGGLFCSQAAAGNGNALSIRVYGEAGGLTWHHEDPGRLILSDLRGPDRILTLADLPKKPEETDPFAVLYRDAAAAILDGAEVLTPGVADGVAGMRFVEACVASAADGGAWISP
ncbi:MAG: Gfo/Idh/MocA family protein [Rubricella sp.]